MFNFLRRVAASAQDFFGQKSKSEAAAHALVVTVPLADRVGGRGASGRLVVTISKPEPIRATVAPQTTAPAAPAPATAATPEAAASSGSSGQTYLKHTVLRSTHHRPSPVAVARRRGKPTSMKPRRAVKAARTPVAVRRASDQSVRMQAALMKCQRRRDADRALARLAEQRPAAQVITLRKAA